MLVAQEANGVDVFSRELNVTNWAEIGGAEGANTISSSSGDNNGAVGVYGLWVVKHRLGRCGGEDRERSVFDMNTGNIVLGQSGGSIGGDDGVA